MIRSAKMKATTPPKLIPPFQSTAASGTLPTEQTNETIATSGPTSGPQITASPGWPTRKKPCQNVGGTQAASAPAINRPPAISIHAAAQSMTKYWLIAVRPSGEAARARIGRSSTTDISIAACPSIRPTAPASARRRASSTSAGRSVRLNSSERSTIMTGPPTNSARVNCQPRRTAMMIPSSITRLVEANWNAIAAVKLAPLRKSDRASATAAYEQEDDAKPNRLASAMLRGESSPNRRAICLLDTSACTAPDRANPRSRGQRISQHITKARLSDWPISANPWATITLSPAAAVRGASYVPEITNATG